MTDSAPDHTANAAYRAARRRAIREHHPDVGGDAESLRRELAAIERRFSGGERHIAHAAPTLVSTGGPIRALAKGIRRALRRLPTRTTYIDI